MRVWQAGEAGGMVAVRGQEMRDDWRGQRTSPHHQCPTALQGRLVLPNRTKIRTEASKRENFDNENKLAKL